MVKGAWRRAVHPEVWVEPIDIIGNHAADALANRGAEMAQVPDSAACRVLKVVATAQLVQRRLIAILCSLESHTFNKVVTKKVDKLPLSATLLASQHQVLYDGSVWRCARCLTTWVKVAQLREGCALPCTPSPGLPEALATSAVKPAAVPSADCMTVGRTALHPPHALNVYKGLWYCRDRGYVAVALAKKLAAPCGGPAPPKSQGRCNLSRIRRDLPPLPLRQWPAENGNVVGQSIICP